MFISQASQEKIKFILNDLRSKEKRIEELDGQYKKIREEIGKVKEGILDCEQSLHEIMSDLPIDAKQVAVKMEYGMVVVALRDREYGDPVLEIENIITF